MASLGDCLASLDPDPSRAGFAFEAVAAWWLCTDPEWSSKVKMVWPAKEWPGRSSGQDLGTDLVVELVDGGLMAVQVKRRLRVTTAEIDSFLADTVDRFDERMLIATTDDIAAHGRTKLRQARAHVIARADLDASPVVWPAGGDLATGRRLDRREARPHQAAAVADALAALETHDRCRVVMACGSGKTLAAQRLAEAVAPDGLVVVAVPSLSLLAQTLASWARDSAVGFDDWLAVCSDPTVTDAPDTSEMPSVTTDPADVAAWLRRDARKGQQVVFVTHASMPVVADALTQSRRAAALLVVDEAHRVAGRGALARLATGDFPTEKRVFLTATPRIYTAATKAKADGEGVEVISMDDEARFGPEAHHLSFAHAVELGLLVDFEIVVSIITDADIHRLVTDRVIAELAGVEADTATLAAHIAVARALHEWDAKRTISFHTRIAQAHDFAAHHQTLAHLVVPDETVIAEATSGKVPAGQRKAALDRLATLHGGADRRLLANARVLSEGVDVPAVDAVAFIDPKRSVIDIAQAVGRAMRTSPGKKRGIVVVPVHLPDGYDAAVAEDQVWKPVWDTLRALRSIDKRLAEQLDQLRYQLGRRKGPTDTPARLNVQSVEPLDAAFLEAVRAEAIRLTTDPWDEWFGLLEAYTDDHGHARPLTSYMTDGGHKLGGWVATQRSRRQKLPFDRKTRLEGLPGWVWDANSAAWEEGFAHLVAFAGEYGHTRVAAKHVDADAYKLGGWVSMQRSNRDRLSEHYKTRLERLPGWVWDPLGVQWEEGFAHLVDFADEHGHARPLQTYVTVDGYRLGQWVAVQRNGQDRVPVERRARLEALPDWVWDTHESAWEEGFSHLVAFADEHGHARPLQNQVTADGYRLGIWVAAQRSRRSREALHPERRARLEGLPGWAWAGWVWDTREASWEEGFAHLVDFADEHGHARPLQTYVTVDGYRLGQWVAVQRNGQDRVPVERRARLEALPDWVWDTHESAWEEGFAALVRFVEREGHARVPGKHVEDGVRLGVWVGSQRSSRRTGRLSSDRESRLGSMTGWAWDPKAVQWEEGFAHLEEYAAEHGHARPPSEHVTADGYRLGRWVVTQRSRRYSGVLVAERRARLEALPGWVWDTHEAAWEEGFSHLVAFADEHGHARPLTNQVAADGYRLGQWVGVQRSVRDRIPDERRTRLDALPGWTWDAIEAQWEGGLALLLRFVEREGHARVPGGHVEDGYPLGKWVSHRRNFYRDGRLSPERAATLGGVEGWEWDPYGADWEEGFAHLRAFAKREGHGRVPQQHREDGYKLGQWVALQRRTHRAGRLSPERVARLREVTGWAWNKYEADWDEGLCRLHAYVEREGHARVPDAHTDPDGYRLGQWVRVQRREHRRRSIDADRIDRLQRIPGWTWEPYDAMWDDAFDHLVSYVDREGHARVPATHIEEGFKLGTWVTHQRTQNRKQSLERERAARLERLVGWSWDPFTERWEQAFGHLVSYVDREGHARVPGGYVERGLKLGTWVSVQRRNREFMSEDRRSRLSALPGWVWDIRDAKWEEGLARLHEYVERKGDARPPVSFVTADGYRLGQWVSVQRDTHRQSRLSSERVVRLEELSGWAWIARSD